MGTIITLSKKTLSVGHAIMLSLIFGIIYAGLGNAYLGFVDPSADPLALLFVIAMAFFGWLAFLVLVVSFWKRVGILSLPSHILITMGTAIVSSVMTWPPFVPVMYSDSLWIFGICIVPVLVTYVSYRLAMRSVKSNPAVPSTEP